jgi:hypothetical protein
MIEGGVRRQRCRREEVGKEGGAGSVLWPVEEVHVHVGCLELVERGDDLLEGRFEPQISWPNFGYQEEVLPLHVCTREESPDEVLVVVLSGEIEEAVAEGVGIAEDRRESIGGNATSAQTDGRDGETIGESTSGGAAMIIGALGGCAPMDPQRVIDRLGTGGQRQRGGGGGDEVSSLIGEPIF